MVYFKNCTTSSGTRFLVILDHEHQPLDKGTRLDVDTPLIGKYMEHIPERINECHLDDWTRELMVSETSKVWILKAANHSRSVMIIDEPLPSLGRRIILRRAEWGDSTRFAGEFHYTTGYWEWTEDILSRCRGTLRAARIYEAVFASLFTYDCNSEIIKAFCEAWCPSTNTLLTSAGEMSISLWDMHTCTGLPLSGLLYDEIVPDKVELRDKTGDLSISRSCRHLLHAYHLIRGGVSGGTVSFEQWARFWSQKTLKYKALPSRYEKKRSYRLKSTHNPSGTIEEFKEWTSGETALFRRLAIEKEHQEETYLAAHLACWLCSFVIPTKEVDLVRPGTFKMACLMAQGKEVNLVIRALANLYRGLNNFSRQPKPSGRLAVFPVHFIYVWLARYFKTHYPSGHGLSNPLMVFYSGENGSRYFDAEEARRRIHKGDQASWTNNIIQREISYIDNGKGQRDNWSYFMSIRSNYLLFRQGRNVFVEPYSPHRFSRQFGFYQDVPGSLKIDHLRETSLTEGALYWRWSTLRESFSKAHLPVTTQNLAKFSSLNYRKWWGQVHGIYLENHIEDLVNPKSSVVLEERAKAASKEVRNADDRDLGGDGDPKVPQTVASSSGLIEAPLTESSKRKDSAPSMEENQNKDSDHHWKRPRVVDPPSPFVEEHNSFHSIRKALFGSDCKEDSGNGEASSSVKDLAALTAPVLEETHAKVAPVFQGAKFMLDYERAFVSGIWEDLRKKIMATPIDSLSSMRDEVGLVMDRIKCFTTFDPSTVETFLALLFQMADDYDLVRSKFSVGPSKEALAQQLAEANDVLKKVQAKRDEESAKVRQAKDEINALKQKMKTLSQMLQQRHTSLQDIEAEFLDAQNRVLTITNTPPVGDGVVEHLKASQFDLRMTLGELRNLDFFFLV